MLEPTQSVRLATAMSSFHSEFVTMTVTPTPLVSVMNPPCGWIASWTKTQRWQCILRLAPRSTSQARSHFVCIHLQKTAA